MGPYQDYWGPMGTYSELWGHEDLLGLLGTYWALCGTTLGGGPNDGPHSACRSRHIPPPIRHTAQHGSPKWHPNHTNGALAQPAPNNRAKAHATQGGGRGTNDPQDTGPHHHGPHSTSPHLDTAPTRVQTKSVNTHGPRHQPLMLTGPADHRDLWHKGKPRQNNARTATASPRADYAHGNLRGMNMNDQSSKRIARWEGNFGL